MANITINTDGMSPDTIKAILRDITGRADSGGYFHTIADSEAFTAFGKELKARVGNREADDFLRDLLEKMG